MPDCAVTKPRSIKGTLVLVLVLVLVYHIQPACGKVSQGLATVVCIPPSILPRNNLNVADCIIKHT